VPIATSVVAAFVLAQDGPIAATEMMRGFVRGIFGTVVFCFLVAVMLGPLGAAAAFAVGFAGVLAVQAVVLVSLRR
jgi:F0F1-type ATP synthase assembly protein I